MDVHGHEESLTMAGGRLTGLYSGIRGLDLGPTKMRNDERFRREQLREDMRRALAGEKIQASELMLREDALKQQADTEMKRQALERELQGQRIAASREESQAQRGFVGQQSGLDRGLRRELQGQEIGARDASQQREIQARQQEQQMALQGQWDMLTAKLRQDSDQFAKEFALRERTLSREEKFDALRTAGMQLENRARELGIAAAQKEQAGQLPPEERQAVERTLNQYRMESARLQNEAAKYAQGRGRQLQEAAAMSDIGATSARAALADAQSEFQRLQTEAGRKQIEKQSPKAKQAGQMGGLEKDDRNEALRLDRLVAEGKGTDVQKAMQKAYGRLNELSGADDPDAKERVEKLREFIKKAKKDESKNWSPSLWWGGFGLAARALTPDSDLENLAEELGLHSGV